MELTTRAQRIMKALSSTEWKSKNKIIEALGKKSLYDGDWELIKILELNGLIESRKYREEGVTITYRKEYRKHE